jgi:hypothetical protein
MSLSPEEEMLLHELVYGDTSSDNTSPDNAQSGGANATKEMQYDKTKELLEKFANNESSELDGALEMLKLTLAVGSQVPSILFAEIINSCNITDQEKLYYNGKLHELISIDIGCIQIGNFVDIAGHTRSGYIVYKVCGDDHHIEDEIRNFAQLCTHNKATRKKIKENVLIQLHQFSRAGYMAYLHMKDVSKEIFDALDTKYPADFDHNELEYNPEKGQFSVKIPNTKKVGIFIETKLEI